MQNSLHFGQPTLILLRAELILVVLLYFFQLFELVHNLLEVTPALAGSPASEKIGESFEYAAGSGVGSGSTCVFLWRRRWSSDSP